jgi:hypothetical protein
LKKAKGLSLLNINCSWVPFNFSVPMDEDQAADVESTTLDIGETPDLLGGLSGTADDARGDVYQDAIRTAKEAASGHDDEDVLMDGKRAAGIDEFLDVGEGHTEPGLAETTTDDVTDDVCKDAIRIASEAATSDVHKDNDHVPMDEDHAVHTERGPFSGIGEAPNADVREGAIRPAEQAASGVGDNNKDGKEGLEGLFTDSVKSPFSMVRAPFD